MAVAATRPEAELEREWNWKTEAALDALGVEPSEKGVPGTKSGAIEAAEESDDMGESSTMEDALERAERSEKDSVRLRLRL